MAHAYASLVGLPATGLRFFTVYGPWGRPDMAMWLLTATIMDGTPLKLFNNGRLRRDFTYIDDVSRPSSASLNTRRSQIPPGLAMRAIRQQAVHRGASIISATAARLR